MATTPYRRTGTADMMERRAEMAALSRMGGGSATVASTSRTGSADAMERRAVAQQLGVSEAEAARIIRQQVDQRRVQQGYAPIYNTTTAAIPLPAPAASTYDPGSGGVEGGTDPLPAMPSPGAPAAGIMPEGDAFGTAVGGAPAGLGMDTSAGRVLRQLQPAPASPLRDVKLGFGVTSRGFKPSQAFRRLKK